MKNILDAYNTFQFLVHDIYQECVNSGYQKDAAVGKLKYELEPLAKNNEELSVLYFELSYYLAKEQLNECFIDMFEKFKKTANLDDPFQIIEENNLLKEEKQNEMCRKKKIIMDYARSIFKEDI